MSDTTETLEARQIATAICNNASSLYGGIQAQAAELADLRSRIGAARVHCREILDADGGRPTPGSPGGHNAATGVAAQVLALLNTARPQEWPPRAATVWADQVGRHWHAATPPEADGVQLVCDLAPDRTVTADPEWVWDTYGPLKRLERGGEAE